MNKSLLMWKHQTTSTTETEHGTSGQIFNNIQVHTGKPRIMYQTKKQFKLYNTVPSNSCTTATILSSAAFLRIRTYSLRAEEILSVAAYVFYSWKFYLCLNISLHRKF